LNALSNVTFADLIAALLAVIGLVTIAILAVASKTIPNEVVAFLTLVSGYLFRGVAPAVGNGVKSIVTNGKAP
jgi:hypothetical protein